MTYAVDVHATVQRLLIELFELAPTEVVPAARLKEELDLDSLDGVNLVVALEKRFALLLEEETMKKLRTVGEIQDYVAASLASQAS